MSKGIGGRMKNQNKKRLIEAAAAGVARVDIRELSARTRLSDATLRKWAQGETLTAETMEKIARALRRR